MNLKVPGPLRPLTHMCLALCYNVPYPMGSSAVQSASVWSANDGGFAWREWLVSGNRPRSAGRGLWVGRVGAEET